MVSSEPVCSSPTNPADTAESPAHRLFNEVPSLFSSPRSISINSGCLRGGCASFTVIHKPPRTRLGVSWLRHLNNGAWWTCP